MKNKIILFLVSLLGMLSNVSYLQAQTCATVSTASVTPYSTQATLFWTRVVGVDNYRIEWRVRGSGSAWQIATMSSSRSTVDFTVNGLAACTNYEARITTLCPTPSTPRAITFRTNGCLPPCGMPSNLSAGPVDINAATLRWRNTGATRYEVAYKTIDAIPNVTTVVVTTDTLRLTNLLSCKNYTFRVRSVCLNAGVTLYSDWSTELVFSTVCPVSCNPPKIRNLLNLTTNSMDLIWDMLPNQDYSIQFKKATDTTWSTLTSAAIRSPYTLAGLAACTRYNIRLRSICNGVGSDWSSHISVTTVCPPPCNTPRNLRVSPLDTAMMVVWDHSVGAQTPPSYVLRYRLVGGDTAWRSVNTGTANIFVLGGLLPCSRYEVSVAAQCSPNTVTAYSSTVVGATVGCAIVCSTPTGLSGYLNDSTTATITWQGTLTSRYVLAYRNLNDNTGMYVMDTITGNSRTLHLQRCGRYVFYLRQMCFGGTASSWSSPFSLQTLCSTSACDAPLNLRAQADTLALLTWNGIAPRYIVEIRNVNNNSVVRTDTVTQNWFIVQGLPRCQGYYAFVKSLCANQTSSVATAYFYLSCPTTCNLVVNQLPALLEGCVGTPSVLAVSASGMGNTYQWEMSVNGLVWTDFPSETRTTLNLRNNVAGTMFVRVRVSNPNCAQPVFSNSSRLVVTNCPLPCAEFVSVIPTVDSMGIVFNVSPTILAGSRDSFEIQYRRTSESVWTRRTTQLNNYRLTGLSPCLPYEARIRRVCPNGETTWRVVNFTIPNASCQQNCELFNAAFFTDSTNTFRLTTTPQLTGADTLQILWRASVGDTTWRDTRVRGDASILPFIGQSCVNYQFQIRRLCASGAVSPYLQRNFAVPGTNCGGSNCNILIGNLPNVLNVCQNTPQSLAANVQGANYTIQWQMSSDSMMWIQLGGATGNNFNVPVNNLGIVFMRYVVNSPNCTSPRISNVSRINVVACICEPIAALQAINDSGRLRVNISPMIAAGSRDTFDVWYRMVQSATTMRFVTTSNNFILPNTQPCERYEVKAQRRCLYNVSPILTSTVGLFTPQCCQEVTNVTARDTAAVTLVTLTTSGTGSAVSSDTFEVEYRKVSETVWSRRTFAGSLTTTLPRFDDCTDYLIRVRRKCMSSGAEVLTAWRQISFRRCDPCALITNVNATNLNGTIVVNISPAASARDTFEIWYNGIRYLTSNATYTISGVQRCEAQEVSVRRRCPSGVSPTVNAAVALQCCRVVTTLTARDSAAGTFVSIAPFNQGDTVEVFYKKLNIATALWVQINVTTNSVMLPRFDSCEDYVLHAMRRCNGVRDYSTLKETVFRRCEACAPITDLLAVNDSGRLKVTIYPRVLTGSGDTFEILYRRVQDATPIRFVSTLFTFTLPNTQPCETYVVQARRLCRFGVSSTTRTATVTLTNALNVPCCQEVATLTARDSSIGTMVSMSPVNSGDTLEVEYRKTSTTVWNRAGFAGQSIVILPRFDECVDYLIRVRRRCFGLLTSWKEISFRRCDPCTLITNVNATNTNGRIVVNISPAASARDTFEIWYRGNRYLTSNATYTIGTGFESCEAQEVSVRRRCPSGVSPTVNAAVALQCCRVVTTLTVRDSAAGTFVSIAPFNQGDTVLLDYRKLNIATAPWVQRYVTTSNVMLPRFDSCEDYVLHATRVCNGVRNNSTLRETVFRRCEACAPITDLLAVNDSGRLKVTIYPRVLTGSRDTFEVLYRRVQDATPMRFVSTIFTFTLPNTQPCETYVVQARRLCISGTSATRTTTVTLTNALNAPCCQEITTLTARDSAIGVVVSMSPVSSGDTIELQYRKVSETTWNTTEFAGRSTTTLPHFGFDICTDYIIRVRRRCGVAFSNWKEVPFRRSIVACLQGGGVSNQRHVIIANESFTLYPNPTSEVLNLNYQLPEASEVRFDILNLQGQMIRTIQLGTQEKGIYQQSVQDISALQTGFYLMTMRINGKVVATQKWQKF